MSYGGKFRQREGPVKVKQCACGGQSRLVNRRNFPFGRGAGARRTIYYRCNACDKIVFNHKPTEVRR